MTIAIIGSRTFKHLDRVREYVNSLPEGTTIVSGGAQGVDIVAELAARKRKLAVQVFLPKWKEHGRAAGYRRNYTIVDAADKVVAFWDGVSRGTKHSIDYAKAQGKPVEIYEEVLNGSSTQTEDDR